jgi:hypothetical protein
LSLVDEEVEDEKAEIRSEWRLERRGNRTPVGYAIYKRGIDKSTGKPPYIGYVGYNSPPKQGLPSYGEAVRSRS